MKACLASLLMAVIVAGSGSAKPARSDEVFHAAIPAGYETIALQPAGAVVDVLALIECPELEGAQKVSHGLSSRVVLADGSQLRYFPSQFSFRVTASLRRALLESPTDSYVTRSAPETFLLNLNFRLKAYDGLQVTEFQPVKAELIGVPREISYDERIYRVSFNLPRLPLTDRCILEVISPDGQKIGHFTFTLL